MSGYSPPIVKRVTPIAIIILIKNHTDIVLVKTKKGVIKPAIMKPDTIIRLMPMILNPFSTNGEHIAIDKK